MNHHTLNLVKLRHLKIILRENKKVKMIFTIYLLPSNINTILILNYYYFYTFRFKMFVIAVL